jgi:hypothetical protein
VLQARVRPVAPGELAAWSTLGGLTGGSVRLHLLPYRPPQHLPAGLQASDASSVSGSQGAASVRGQPAAAGRAGEAANDDGGECFELEYGPLLAATPAAAALLRLIDGGARGGARGSEEGGRGGGAGGIGSVGGLVALPLADRSVADALLREHPSAPLRAAVANVTRRCDEVDRGVTSHLAWSLV